MSSSVTFGVWEEVCESFGNVLVYSVSVRLKDLKALLAEALYYEFLAFASLAKTETQKNVLVVLLRMFQHWGHALEEDAPFVRGLFSIWIFNLVWTSFCQGGQIGILPSRRIAHCSSSKDDYVHQKLVAEVNEQVRHLKKSVE
eukprot:4712670-Amphidinium_carterae.1